MLKKELFSICSLYAVSPVHAGSGSSTSVVDLPIQRERHTNWPHIQASGVKGAFRDHYRSFAGEKQYQTINFIFGSDKYNDSGQKGHDGDHPGAISISDAKILAFPMRSNIAPFVWVTCPSVLNRFRTDLDFSGFSPIDEPPHIERDDEAVVVCGVEENNIVLEDVVVSVNRNKSYNFTLPEGFSELPRLLLVSDAVFDYCVSSCTEVQTQIKIDAEKGTALDHGLRYQELLPSDTLLYSVVYFSRSAGMNELQASVIQEHMEDVIKNFVQIGGDETLGRGIFKINWSKK